MTRGLEQLACKIFCEDHEVEVIIRRESRGREAKRKCFCGEEFWSNKFAKHIRTVHSEEYAASVDKVGGLKSHYRN